MGHPLSLLYLFISNDTCNLLNMQHKTSNWKRLYYSDIPGGGGTWEDQSPPPPPPPLHHHHQHQRKTSAPTKCRDRYCMWKCMTAFTHIRTTQQQHLHKSRWNTSHMLPKYSSYHIKVGESLTLHLVVTYITYYDTPVQSFWQLQYTLYDTKLWNSQIHNCCLRYMKFCLKGHKIKPTKHMPCTDIFT